MKMDPRSELAFSLIEGVRERFRNQVGLQVSDEFVAEANQTLDEIAKLFAN